MAWWRTNRAASRAAACRSTASTSASGNFRASPASRRAAGRLLMTAALAQELGAKRWRFDSDPRGEAFGDSAGVAARPQGGRGQVHPPAPCADAPFREFSLRPQQGDVRAVFVPLARLQSDLAAEGKVNTILAREQPAWRILKDPLHAGRPRTQAARLDKQHALALESDSAVIGDRPGGQPPLATAKSLGLRVEPVSLTSPIASALAAARSRTRW